MSFKTVLHSTQSPHYRRLAGTESHKGTTAACQLWRKQSRVRKLLMLIKRRWLARSNECNLLDDLIGDFLNVGQKVCRLPRPSPSKRRQVKPKMEASCRSVKEGNEKSYSQCRTESYSDSLYMYETELHLSTIHNHTPT